MTTTPGPIPLTSHFKMVLTDAAGLDLLTLHKITSAMPNGWKVVDVTMNGGRHKDKYDVTIHVEITWPESETP